ncbi:MAG: serine/threonine-protein kinase [bacterium]
MSEGVQPAVNLPNFEMLELLGKGGMAAVWKARQISLDRMVAVKILATSFVETEEDLKQFRQEARTAAQLKHPNIVQVYDANFSNGSCYFVMELVEGYTMGDWLRRKKSMPVEDALIIAESVAVALDYAWNFHAMVHCDIKPDNIMADADGTVKVTDLGLCKTFSRIKDNTNISDDIWGTPAYMSPEQIYGTTHLDCRSDIYSLGASLYHLITGRSLFIGLDDENIMRAHVGQSQAPDPRIFVPHIKMSVVTLLERMLAKHPDNRYQDWKEVLRDLHLIHNNQPIDWVALPPFGSSMQKG